MNFKNLTAPLTEKIGNLTALVQDMIDNLEEQTEIQKEILKTLKGIKSKDVNNERDTEKHTPES